MSDVPDVPSAEALPALPAAELAARLAEAYRLIGELSARVEQLERLARRDSLLTEQRPVFPQFSGRVAASVNTVPGHDQRECS